MVTNDIFEDLRMQFQNPIFYNLWQPLAVKDDVAVCFSEEEQRPRRKEVGLPKVWKGHPRFWALRTSGSGADHVRPIAGRGGQPPRGEGHLGLGPKEEPIHQRVGQDGKIRILGVIGPIFEILIFLPGSGINSSNSYPRYGDQKAYSQGSRCLCRRS